MDGLMNRPLGPIDADRLRGLAAKYGYELQWGRAELNGPDRRCMWPDDLEGDADPDWQDPAVQESIDRPIPVRWQHDHSRSGSVHRSLWDWSTLDGCFGNSKIRVGDIDGFVERRGRVLFIETKYPGSWVPTRPDEGIQGACDAWLYRPDCMGIIGGPASGCESSRRYRTRPSTRPTWA